MKCGNCFDAVKPSPKSQEEEEAIATFGRRLRVLRLWSGLSEAEMARMLGISVRTLKRREAGTTGGRGLPWLIFSLAQMFGVSTDWLLDSQFSDAYRDETRPLAPGGLPLRRVLAS